MSSPRGQGQSLNEIDVPALAGRIAAAVRGAVLDPRPSDNFFIEDVFPADIYAQMLARLPGAEALDFIEHPDAVAPDGRVTRKLMDFTDASLGRLPEKDRGFWRGMMKVFTSEVLLDALAERFRETLEAQFGSDRPAMVAVPLLYLDYPGYRIGIHPDAATKIATLQFYLPKDLSQTHLGTTFHDRSEDGFIELKTNPFRPNSAYGFVRTDRSWHSVKELGAQEAVRNTIALTVYHQGLQYRSAM